MRGANSLGWVGGGGYSGLVTSKVAKFSMISSNLRGAGYSVVQNRGYFWIFDKIFRQLGQALHLETNH